LKKDPKYEKITDVSYVDSIETFEALLWYSQ